MAKKIGIFGGTFNPIHVGHLRAAVEIQEGFGLDAVYLIPSASPPHKGRANLAPAADRMAMVQKAIEGHRGLRASDIELKRKGPSFTIDTVCSFRKHLPEDAWLYLVMGLDAFLEIETWKSYQDLLHIIPLIVINRPDHQGRLQPSVTHAVKDLLARVRKVNLIPQDMRFVDFKRYFAKTKQHYFPVMDQNGRLNGIFSSTDIRGVLFAPEIEHLVVMKDIATSDVVTAVPSEDLNSVLQKFTVKNIDSLPVVQEDDRGLLLGMLTRRDVISFYNRQIQRLKGAQEPA